MKRRRGITKGLLTISLIGTIFTTTLFGGWVTEKVADKNSHTETINISSEDYIILGIKDSDTKAKIEEVLNETIADIKTDKIDEIDKILNGEVTDLDTKEYNEIPIKSVSVNNIIEREIHLIKQEKIEYELSAKREQIIFEREEEERRIKAHEEFRRKEEEKRVRLIKEAEERAEKKRIEKEQARQQTIQATSRGSNASGRSLGSFQVTAYDLSVDSCGKPIGSKGYGKTASGHSLIGHTWDSARTIAADTRVIPMGSRVRITFDNPNYSKYNGTYTVRDRGGAIKGNIVDFFMGDFNQNKAHQDVWNFGRTNAKIEILD